MIETLEQAGRLLQSWRGRRKWWRVLARHSAVAIPMREGDRGLEILMIERAHREGDRWSGHMAFPGGMLHPDDADSLAGAMRETREEIGVDLARQGRLLTRLSDIGSISHIGHRRPLIIHPYVFAVDQELSLRLNHEVAGTVWVPLRHLADPSNRSVMDWYHGKRRLRLSFYMYAEKRIWGLSLRMIDELMRSLASEAAMDEH